MPHCPRLCAQAFKKEPRVSLVGHFRCLACKLCWTNGALTNNLYVQKAYRGRFIYTDSTYDAAKKSLRRIPIRLHRRNLADRLGFEAALTRGFLRLVNQALIFCLMVSAAMLSSEPAVKRGIYNNLIDAFQLHELQRSSCHLRLPHAHASLVTSGPHCW